MIHISAAYRILPDLSHIYCKLTFIFNSVNFVKIGVCVYKHMFPKYHCFGHLLRGFIIVSNKDIVEGRIPKKSSPIASKLLDLEPKKLRFRNKGRRGAGEIFNF